MIRKGMKLYSIIFGVCPKCHQESMYTTKNPFILSNTLKINDNCSYCNTKYRMEPSFFYGAMYVSYGLSIVFAIIAFIVSYTLIETSLIIAFLSIVLTLVGFMPLIMRLSRSIWINLFMNYDKSITINKSD